MFVTFYLICCFLYCKAAIEYLNKCMCYSVKEEKHRLWDAFHAESREATLEYRSGNWVELLIELADVHHCWLRIVQYYILSWITKDPCYYLLKWWMWLPFCFICPISVVKTGIRYINFGCPRNHWRKMKCNCSSYNL
jgi:hypothetical protein